MTNDEKPNVERKPKHEARTRGGRRRGRRLSPWERGCSATADLRPHPLSFLGARVSPPAVLFPRRSSRLRGRSRYGVAKARPPLFLLWMCAAIPALHAGLDSFAAIETLAGAAGRPSVPLTPTLRRRPTASMLSDRVAACSPTAVVPARPRLSMPRANS